MMALKAHFFFFVKWQIFYQYYFSVCNFKTSCQLSQLSNMEDSAKSMTSCKCHLFFEMSGEYLLQFAESKFDKRKSFKNSRLSLLLLCFYRKNIIQLCAKENICKIKLQGCRFSYISYEKWLRV